MQGSLFAESTTATPRKISVGIVSVLSGDLSILGDNAVKTIATYEKYYLRHPLHFSFQDAKINSTDGLSAYQHLINVQAVDILLGVCTSNATVASSSLINSSKTVTFAVATGGYSIDKAGSYVFRVGNSDVLNGIQQSNFFIGKNLKRVALLTEQTEYTQDIAKAFRAEFVAQGGALIFDQEFSPGTSDFRSLILKIKQADPKAIFMPTQTGTSLGLFLKQWHAQGGGLLPIYTTFVAAPNRDAHAIAGDKILGVGYMSPSYNESSPRLDDFFAHFSRDHGALPSIAFHSAGIIDSLDILQLYLDQTGGRYRNEDFQKFLSTDIKEYPGTLGTFSFDDEGNSSIGFRPALITGTKLR